MVRQGPHGAEMMNHVIGLSPNSAYRELDESKIVGTLTVALEIVWRSQRSLRWPEPERRWRIQIDDRMNTDFDEVIDFSHDSVTHLPSKIVPKG